MSDTFDYEPEPEHFHHYAKNRDYHITRDGKKINIEDMTDKHLFNTAKKLGNQIYINEMIFRLFKERLC